MGVRFSHEPDDVGCHETQQYEYEPGSVCIHQMLLAERTTATHDLLLSYGPENTPKERLLLDRSLVPSNLTHHSITKVFNLEYPALIYGRSITGAGYIGTGSKSGWACV